MDLGALAAYLKLPARIYAAAAIVSGALLFGPTTFLATIGLEQFSNEHRAVLGFSFLIAVALFVAELGHVIWRHRRSSAEKREARIERENEATAEQRRNEAERARALVERQNYLARLTHDEKQMLQPYVAQNLRARRLPMNSATLTALRGAEILGQVGQMVEYDHAAGDYMVEVFIQPWAMDYLREHPELVRF